MYFLHLQSALQSKNIDVSQVVYLHLQIDMEQFGEVNKMYQTLFSHLPPVRVCI